MTTRGGDIGAGRGKAEASRTLKRAPRQGERGFALLVVFLISAGIMISLYLELPRVAFESQRNREEMLVERGEQYSRAIEVYFRKNKRYPGKLEDLENTNNIRFLRRRYKDPLTGKDEWRIIHMGAAGQLADSLVEKPGQQAGQQLAGAQGIPPAPGAAPDPDGVNSATLRAQRDQNALVGRRTLAPGMPGYDPNNPNAGQQQQQQQLDPNGNPIVDQNQQQQTGASVFNNPGSGQPGFNPNFQQQNPNFPGQYPPPGINPNGIQPGTVNYQNPQGFSNGGQLQGQLGAQLGQNPVQAGFGPNPALNAINNQLRNQAGFMQPQPGGGIAANQIPPGAIRMPDGTFKMPDGSVLNADGSPRYIDPSQVIKPVIPGQNPTNPFNSNPPGTSGFNTGQPGLGQGSGFGTAAQLSQQPGGQAFGGAGIAGVASTQAGVGIKRYNDRSKYKEWEFVFDYRKPKTKPTTGVTGLKTSDLPHSNVIKPN